MLLARTGTLTVALLAGDIGQSGLVPGREQVNVVLHLERQILNRILHESYLYTKLHFRIFASLLARTGTLTVALLAGDIGQSGLVPGRERATILE